MNDIRRGYEMRKCSVSKYNFDQLSWTSLFIEGLLRALSALKWFVNLQGTVGLVGCMSQNFLTLEPFSCQEHLTGWDALSSTLSHGVDRSFLLEKSFCVGKSITSLICTRFPNLYKGSVFPACLIFGGKNQMRLSGRLSYLRMRSVACFLCPQHLVHESSQDGTQHISA